jgi:hypothetical protein
MVYREKKHRDILYKLNRKMNKNPIERLTNIYSTGGHVARSYKDTVGKIVNRNISKRYDTVKKTLERIDRHGTLEG